MGGRRGTVPIPNGNGESPRDREVHEPLPVRCGQYCLFPKATDVHFETVTHPDAADHGQLDTLERQVARRRVKRIEVRSRPIIEDDMDSSGVAGQHGFTVDDLLGMTRGSPPE